MAKSEMDRVTQPLDMAAETSLMHNVLHISESTQRTNFEEYSHLSKWIWLC